MRSFRSKIVSKTMTNGSCLSFETGKLAHLANGAVFARFGDTTMLTTSVVQGKLLEDKNFMPLSVEFREKSYAAGKIPRTWARREVGSSDQEILKGRIVDRALRPLFPKGFFYDTQIINTITSYDNVHDADVLAINAASASLCVSDIPWNGPVGAVRIGLSKDKKLIVNPSDAQKKDIQMSLLYAGNATRTVMIECDANEVDERHYIDAMKLAHEEIQHYIDLQKELRDAVGKEKEEYPVVKPSTELVDRAKVLVYERATAIFGKPDLRKPERNDELRVVRLEAKEIITNEFINDLEEGVEVTTTPVAIGLAIEDAIEKAYRHAVLRVGGTCKSVDNEAITTSGRPDGRDLNQLRQLHGEVGTVPMVHGSSFFGRGDTSALCVITLNKLQMLRSFDPITGGRSCKSTILQYEFPPYCVNETGRVGGINRRAVGHGALAEKALDAVLPPSSEFPYTVKMNSEILTSDGSSSMATVCGVSLSLMDAGVPIKSHVAGISIGLVTENDKESDANADVGEYRVLTDILGLEDHCGDMDYKVAGTSKGLTAVQLDVKLSGVPLPILIEGTHDAVNARSKILDVMNEAIPNPRKQLKDGVLRVAAVPIVQDDIAKIVGAGRSTMSFIESNFGADVWFPEGKGIDMSELNLSSSAFVYAKTQENLDAAVDYIKDLTVKIQAGSIHEACVVEIRDFGALLKIGALEGYMHASEFSHAFMDNLAAHVDVGEKFQVKVLHVDERTGRIKLSKKALIPLPNAGEGEENGGSDHMFPGLHPLLSGSNNNHYNFDINGDDDSIASTTSSSNSETDKNLSDTTESEEADAFIRANFGGSFSRRSSKRRVPLGVSIVREDDNNDSTDGNYDNNNDSTDGNYENNNDSTDNNNNNFIESKTISDTEETALSPDGCDDKERDIDYFKQMILDKHNRKF